LTSKEEQEKLLNEVNILRELVIFCLLRKKEIFSA